jgi:ubiquinone/menaquinone biosynthesis C-methylase UbiE
MAARPGPQRWFFDLWSRVYDLPIVQRTAYRPIHDVVLRILRDRRARAVLDVGCGTGQLISRVAETLPNGATIGCDFSQGMLSEAARRSGRPHWVRGDAAMLPFADGVFDAVVSTEAFHWFPDQDAALAEFHRVLKPRGCLLLAVVNPSTSLLSDVAYAGSRIVGEPFYWPTSEHIRRRVGDAGFRVRRQRRIFRFPGSLLFPPVLTIAERTAR